MSDRGDAQHQSLPVDAAAPFRLPAEWEPQAAIWLAWPHNRQTWPGRFDTVPPFFVRWIETITDSTPVRVLAAGDALRQAESQLTGCRHVEIVEIPTNDCWIRDYGPAFVHNRHTNAVEAIDWKFNAWGGKYPPWDDDQSAAEAICTVAGLTRHISPLCLEGGALESDGRGRLLTTPGCLVTPTRNPDWSADEISRELHRWLGVEEIVWIDGGGLEGDDTDGHIDQLARMIDPENVVVAVSDDPRDPNAAGLEHNLRQLRLWGQSTEPPVEVHRLPIPPCRSIDGRNFATVPW